MSKVYKIGTRSSQLALYQANLVKDLLQKIYPEKTIELKHITTKGDVVLDVALSKIGDKGLFTKELEVQLITGEIDMAVHSLKDLPTVFPEGMQLGAILERAEHRDALVSKNNLTLDQLTPEHKIATSSLRRKSQLLRINPDFNIIDIRGNVNTRIRKMDEGYCDAMVMAGAGLLRLDMGNRITALLEKDVMIIAPGQGAIAIEVKGGNKEVLDLIAPLNHKETADIVSAERAFLEHLQGGCQVPVGSFATISGNKLHLQGIISSLDGKTHIEGKSSGNIEDAREIGLQLAEKLAKEGGNEILSQIRS